MSIRTIYIVEGSGGSWEPEYWMVRAFTDRDKALAWAKEAGIYHKKLLVEYEDHWKIPLEANPFDLGGPVFWDNSYDVHELVLEE